MRHILLLFFLVLAFTQNISAKDASITEENEAKVEGMAKYRPSYKKTVYWKRHLWEKGLAIGSASLGVCGMATGYILAVAGIERNDRTSSTGKAILYTGMVVTAASIPLFVFSHRDARKAKQSTGFYLQSSNMPVTTPEGKINAQPAIGLCMTF